VYVILQVQEEEVIPSSLSRRELQFLSRVELCPHSTYERQEKQEKMQKNPSPIPQAKD
jgi:hypothetical protein